MLEVIGYRETFAYIAVKEYGFRKLPVAIGAYVCAKYMFIEKMAKYFLVRSMFYKSLFLCACILFYNWVQNIGTVSTGLFLTPIFVAIVAAFNLESKIMGRRIVSWLGKHSMNIWFLHCIFFAVATKQVFQPYAYWMGNPFLVISWILLVCGVVSIPLTKLQDIVNTKINSFFGEG